MTFKGFSDLSYIDLSYGKLALINMTLLIVPWVTSYLYGIIRKNSALILIGMGFFLLFVKEWLVIVFGYTYLDFTMILFWELFFFFSFSWLITKIYQECVIRNNDYFFFDVNSESCQHPQPFSETILSFIYRLNPFSFIGGILFILALTITLTMISVEPIKGIIACVFFLMMVLPMERALYHWGKDYVYLGSPWTHYQIIYSFKFFYSMFSLGFLVLLTSVFIDFLGWIDFSKRLPQILSVFALSKVISLISIYWFLYHFYNCHSQVIKGFEAISADNEDWIQKTFTIDNQDTITLSRFKEKYPNILFSQTHEVAALTMLQYLVQLLKKSRSDWVYFYEPGYPFPEKRVVMLHNSNIAGKDVPDTGTEKLNPENYLPKIQKLLDKQLEFFFYQIQSHSIAFQKAFKNFFWSIPDHIHSFIIYPFSFHKKPCSLLLVNSKFDTPSFRPFHVSILARFSHKFSQVNFFEKQRTLYPKNNDDPVNQIKDQPEKISKVNSEVTLFPETQKKKDIISKINKEKILVENVGKALQNFYPANNRQVDGIIYEITDFFSDQIQNTLLLASHIGEKGKLFVFNQIKQNPSSLATTELNLLNLFYSQLSKKNANVFIDEWQRKWKPVSSSDRCQSLAIEFHPDNNQFMYFNAGVTLSYHYNSKYDVFIPLKVHQSSLYYYSKKKFPSLPISTQLQINPDDLIVIFSKELTKIKNRSGKKLEVKMLLDNIKKNSKGSPKDISHSLSEEINHFIYSSVKFKQIIFIAKILG